MVKNITALCTFLVLATAAQTSHAQMGGFLGQVQRGAAKAGGDAADHMKDRYFRANQQQGSWLSEVGGRGNTAAQDAIRRQQETARRAAEEQARQARIRQQQIDA